MSKEGQKGILLTKDGSFQKVRLKKGAKATVGQTVYDSDIAVRPAIAEKIPIAMAACLTVVIVFGVISGFVRNNAIAAYVSIDVNPSIEAAVNREFRIVNVKGLNEDGEVLLQNGIKYKDMPLKEFTLAIADELSEEGYMTDQPDIVVSTILTDEVDESRRKSFKNKLSEAVKKLKTNHVFQKNKGTLEVYNTTMDRRHEAEKAGLSTGKYLIYLKDGKSEKNLKISQVKHMTVKELHQAVGKGKVKEKKQETVHAQASHSKKNNGDVAAKDHPNNGHPNVNALLNKEVEKLAEPKQEPQSVKKNNPHASPPGLLKQKEHHKRHFHVQEGYQLDPFKEIPKQHKGKGNIEVKRAG